ncbi:metalloregulator ArsR/SmtB family transcription factor [Kitasatospora sp. NPDC049285]|uniref:ArsR/SmtB family transcription factor n=1 Tax=Kitasatospora sp. NPDC049285 TaxID=3157096 RepID=UPI0034377D43
MTTHPTSSEEDLAPLLEALKALANPVRLQVLQWLREPERHFPVEPAVTDPRTVGVCVSHIQARTGLAQSTVSAYMAVLERAGLVRSTRVGKWTHYRRDEQRIAALVGQLGNVLGAAELAGSLR